MSGTVDEVLALQAAAAAAGYPTSVAVLAGAVRPAVTVGLPTIEPVTGVCDGHNDLTVAVRVTGAGVTVEQLLDLVQAVDDVMAVMPPDWTITTAAPDQLPDDTPAYTITASKET